MTPPAADLRAYLSALVACEPSLWIELRLLPVGAGLVQRRFIPGARLPTAVDHVLGAAPSADVLVGVAPRVRPRGDRSAVPRGWTLWVDCDDAAALQRLAAVPVAPSMVVRSGSEYGAHAYWLLDRPLARAELERANRRLAHALGADLRSVDAARMLRPPATLNHKTIPARAVALETYTGERHDPGSLLAHFPAAPAAQLRTMPEHALRRADGRADRLRDIPPDTYVERILGLSVPRSRKLACPFHEDRHPSLHVYREPERGWFCFGCRRGGTIYDLAATAWGITPRGAAFRELRGRLQAAFTTDPGSRTA
jgi:hypothetical protein